MIDGCIHTTTCDGQYYCKLYQDKVTPSRGIMSKRCRGTAAEKQECPEWGPTVAAESYYLKKLEKLTKYRRNRQTELITSRS